MTKPKTGFRRTGDVDRRGGGALSGGSDPGDSAGSTGGPFSQAQIIHLMKSEFTRARRYGYPVSVILMRVDELGALTEKWGAAFRVALKRAITRVVESKTRGHDHLGAMSDGNYLLVLPHTGSEDSCRVAERVRGAVAGHPVSVASSEVEVRLSLGVASCSGGDTMFFDTLVSQAEMALESAALAGGDRVQLFERGAREPEA